MLRRRERKREAVMGRGNSKAGRADARRIRSDRRGMVAVMTAILAPVLMTALAISVDVAYWRYRSGSLQAAADAVAVSVAMDIQAMGCGSQSTAALCSRSVLQVNALGEAARNGCSAGCTLTTFNWPYVSGGVSNYGAAEVTLGDGSARRFFSTIYDTSAKTLRGRAVAQVAGGGTATASGSGCALLLGAMAGSQRGLWDWPSWYGDTDLGPSGCEVIANFPGPDSVHLDASGQGTPRIQADLTTSGDIYVYNQPSMYGMPGRAVDFTGLSKVRQPPTADPYAGSYTITAASLGTTADYNKAGPYACAGVWTDSSTLNAPVLTGDGSATDPGLNTQNNMLPAGSPAARMNGGQFRWNAADQSWHFSQPNANFCKGLWISGTKVTFDPGTVVIGGSTPNPGGYLIYYSPPSTLVANGVTFVLAPDLDRNSQLPFSKQTISAPPLGVPGNGSLGFAGLAVTQFTDDVTEGALELYTASRWQGAIYLPTKLVDINDMFTPWTVDAGQPCAQVVARSMSLSNGRIALGNAGCTAAMGVLPFGTYARGWSTSGGGGTGGSGSGGGTGGSARAKLSE